MSDIQRCPHDKENPYSMINRDLIRNKELSPECRWLIILCLSYTGNWKISIPYFIKDQQISKDRMYSMLNEAIETGYMQRTEYLEKGFKKYKYLVSETPKFKKCLLCPENPDTENPDTENQDTTKNESSPKGEETNKQYNERSASPSPSADASAVAHLFLEKIKEKKADFKPKAFDRWASDVDKMIRLDGRDPEKIKEVISWMVEDITNLVYIQSAQKLREKFDSLEIKMQTYRAKGLIRNNREYALCIKDKYPDKLKSLTFDDKYVGNRALGKEVPFNLPHESFKEQFLSLFGGNRV